jgi:hypothetical protein
MTALRLVWLSLSTTWLWKFWSRLAKTSEESGAAEIPRRFSALDQSDQWIWIPDPGGQKWPTKVEKKIKKFNVLKRCMFSF